ncbi:hypothetical protein [Halomonas salipaludis]|uniref:Uncharacterized protein n=1 Tax=Halomonas salipaludis TaxID=2032625 RepID=A0A2A2F3I7_9GAMM|nr:hypothetical protein [Halomonas salipaludis]PAU79172.1 hypothetical protein CK498_02045 [Halomonas salipaludis]
METASYQDDDQRAVLTLSIEGAKFSEMGMGRVGEIFGLLAQVAGEDSVLVRYSGGEIIIKEGRPGGASDSHRSAVEKACDNWLESEGLSMASPEAWWATKAWMKARGFDWPEEAEGA